MKYFNGITTIEDLKKEYKRLALKYHPDLGGDTQTMQAINNEYEQMFKALKNKHKTADGRTYTAKEETTETASEFVEIINSLINIIGIEIEVCGSWLWVTGNTYPHRAALKKLGFGFSGSKKAWYWHKEPYIKKGRKSYTMDEIRNLHGSQKVVTTQNAAICG
ncbi:MAG: molecular chaperone DnaJ [Alphaproteobacteria bacterium]|nr:molecular chaperone DnaJ [Alphaproteobacteria bacterium]